MKKEKDVLSRIEALREPRHMFILPAWADPALLDRLIREGYVTCQHQQRDDNGAISVAMGLQLTPKADRLLHPLADWQQLAFKGSMACASFTVMSLLILYLA